MNHYHLCQDCLHHWQHTTGEAERRASHLCPKCGAGPYYEALRAEDLKNEKAWYCGQDIDKTVTYSHKSPHLSEHNRN